MHELRVTTFAVLALAYATPAQAQSPYGIGRAATPEEVAGWNIDVGGSSLPPGSGSVSRGHQVFDQQCALRARAASAIDWRAGRAAQNEAVQQTPVVMDSGVRRDDRGDYLPALPPLLSLN